MARKRKQKNKPFPVKPQRQQPGQPHVGQTLEITPQVLQATSFSGPIPHPDLMRKYDEILPGAANRIISMAEEQQSHRHRLEAMTIEGANKRANTGMWLGFIVCIFVTTFAGGLALAGHPEIGGVIAAFELPSLAGVFVIGRRRQERERRESRALVQQ